MSVRRRKDRFYFMAKSDGYRSRSAYKLLQMNARHRVIRQGDKVVDIGCCPGGWLQVATELSGGNAVGIDIRKTPPVEGAVVLEGSIQEPESVGKLIAALGGKADVVLCDAAPDIVGKYGFLHVVQISIVRSALNAARPILKKGGNAVFKAYQGELLEGLLMELESSFDRVILEKPPASKTESREIYVICMEYRPRA